MFIPLGHTSNVSHLYFVVVGVFIRSYAYSCEANRKCEKTDIRFLHIDANMQDYIIVCSLAQATIYGQPPDLIYWLTTRHSGIFRLRLNHCSLFMKPFRFDKMYGLINFYFVSFNSWTIFSSWSTRGRQGGYTLPPVNIVHNKKALQLKANHLLSQLNKF